MWPVAIVFERTALEQMESLCKGTELKKGLVAFRSLKCWGPRGMWEPVEA